MASRDPTALLPEALLVFEVTGALSNLAAALSRIPTLSLVAEDVAEAAEDGEDPGFLYLMIPDAEALGSLESLWRRWERGDQLYGMSGVRDLFACLKSVRRWSAQDRVSDADAAILGDMARETPGSRVGVEIELVFRDDETRSRSAEDTVEAAVAGAGGEVLDRARHPEFASHAMLVSLPAAEVERIARRGEGTLADLQPIMSIGPQCRVSTDLDVDVAGPASIEAGLPERAPIAALFDAVPDLQHPFLVDRFVLDDPDALDARSVGVRYHGTSMLSLLLHGDLNSPGTALGRPVYVRPLMYAPDAGTGREVFPDNRLIVDRFYDAVTRMKTGLGGVRATSPAVVVVNVSLGDSRRRFSGKLSRWARAIDDLAWRHKLLFVISAGNLDMPGVDDVPVAAFADQRGFREATDAARAEAILSGIAASIRDRALLAPADSVNGLTVGAAHLDNVTMGSLAIASSYAAYADGSVLANVSSAPGPGFNRSVKPEILMPGGKERVAPVATPAGVSVRVVRPSRTAGLRVAAQSTALGLPSGETTYAGQTSSAAAMATRTAHRIHDALENAYGELFTGLNPAHRALVLKALLVHRARWTDATAGIEQAFGGAAAGRARRTNVARLLGYGVVDPEEAVFCASNRATAWGTGRLGPKAAATFRVPLPSSLAGAPGERAVTATVAWFSPTYPGRRSYRQVRMTLADPQEPDLGRLGIKKDGGQPDLPTSKRGTVAHRRYAGRKAAALVVDDAIELRVQRENDIGTPLAEDVPFAIAVTVEAGADIAIYDEVAARLSIQPAVQVPQTTVVVDAST